MQKNVELLAPAGSYESFIAAVENGANAVYLGGKLFNARAGASNFNIDELKRIVEYAHLRDVKIHVTINTLLNDSEVYSALRFAYDIYKIGVDAIIVQDLGFAKLVHDTIPNLELHASTQLSTHNLEGVKKLKEIGFKRVVLARELSIKEIKHICTYSDVEIEIFSHGAQCVCYSGECLISSMIGDRSGNRGKCAQPCRLPYELLKEEKNNTVSLHGKGYLLSPKDLSTLEILNELPNVACLKIEGRMKSPEYVATVVSLYRKYLDNLSSVVSLEDKNDLAQIFNRGGFSNAYLKGKTGSSMMCYEKPKNWGLYVGKVLEYDGRRIIKTTNEGKIDLEIGDGIEVWNGSNESPSCLISELNTTKNGYEIGRIFGEIEVGNKVYRTSSKVLNQKAKESYSRGFRVHKKVDATITISKNEPVKVTVEDFIYKSDIIPEIANNAPISKDKIEEQFRKTGSTPFEIGNLDISVQDNLFLPVSKINELRRNALDKYSAYYISKTNKYLQEKSSLKLTIKEAHHIPKDTSKKSIALYLNIFKEEYLNLKNVDSFYINFKDILNNSELISSLNCKKYAVFPNVTKANYAKIIKDNIKNIAKIVDGFVISNIGQLEYVKSFAKKTKLIANYTLNAFNTEAIELYNNFGLTKIILSPELTKNQINYIASVSNNIEVMAYGKVCVMTSEYCPIGAIVGKFSKDKECSKPCIKNENYFLKDRLGMDFRVIPDNIDCQSKIFNSKINSVDTKELFVNNLRVDLLDETFEEAQIAINSCLRGEKLIGEKYTNGHFARPV